MVRCVKAIACILHVCLLQMVIISISISISITLKSLIWILYHLHGEDIEQQALSSFFGLGNWPFLVRICFRKPLLGRYPWMQGAKINTFWVDLIQLLWISYCVLPPTALLRKCNKRLSQNQDKPNLNHHLPRQPRLGVKIRGKIATQYMSHLIQWEVEKACTAHHHHFSTFYGLAPPLLHNTYTLLYIYNRHHSHG